MFPVKIFPNVTLSTLFYWFIKKNLTSEMTHDWLLSHNNLGSGVWGYASLPVRVLSQTAGKQNIFSLCGEESRINVERHCSCTPRMPHSNRNNPSFPISSFHLLNPDHKHGNKIYNLSGGVDQQLHNEQVQWHLHLQINHLLIDNHVSSAGGVCVLIWSNGD